MSVCVVLFDNGPLWGLFVAPAIGEGPTKSPHKETFHMNETQTIQYLHCERLDAYRVALELHRALVPIARGRELYSLRDQMLRAAESVVLNIAEGAGRVSPADKRRHYAIAAGSAMEVGACLDLLRNRDAITQSAYHPRRALVIRTMRILARLAGPPRGGGALSTRGAIEEHFASPGRAGEAGEEAVEADGVGAAGGVGGWGDRSAVAQAVQHRGAFDERALRNGVEARFVVAGNSPRPFGQVEHHAVGRAQQLFAQARQPAHARKGHHAMVKVEREVVRDQLLVRKFEFGLIHLKLLSGRLARPSQPERASQSPRKELGSEPETDEARCESPTPTLHPPLTPPPTRLFCRPSQLQPR